MRRGLVVGAGRRLGLVVLFGAAMARFTGADTIQLKSGDRITGTVTASGKKQFRVVTPYGRLVIPADRVDKIVYDDGREEVFMTAPAAAPWKVEVLRLTLAVKGDSFWQAWDPRDAPGDPTLRLLVSLDGQPVAAYVDPQLDSDIRGAVVNTFAFEPAQTTRTEWDGARALPPETEPGAVNLVVELDPSKNGRHELTLAYQWNHGTQEQPGWRDLLTAAAAIDIRPVSGAVVSVEQSRGDMSFGGTFGRKKMRKAETFRLQLTAEGPPSVAAPTPSP
jgi:hypothetical protein